MTPMQKQAIDIKRNAAAALILFALIGLAACQRSRFEPEPAAPAHSSLLRLGRLEFAPCSLQGEHGGVPLPARCTSLDVAEDPRRRDGRRIRLGIAWLPATDDSMVEPDPLFFIAGGPGQSAWSSYPSLDPALAQLRRHRHMILLDQRGTGHSNRLDCTLADADPASAAASAAACRDALSSRADLRHYATTDAVRDLDVVRQALGVERINLLAVSYGTRVAQHYAMRHRAHTRSLILDSPMPNAVMVNELWTRNLDDALALQFTRCRQDATCERAVGDPHRELETLLKTLRARPVQVHYRDASSGQMRHGLLNAKTVADLVRMFAYTPAAASVLPILIHDANRGHYAALMALSHNLRKWAAEHIAMGMQLSVICTEEGARLHAEDAGNALGVTPAATMAAACGVWPKGDLPADFHTPLSGNVPTLILSGQFDPVTPPRYGRQIAAALSNARLLVLAGQGHTVIGEGCVPTLLNTFLERLQPDTLNADCLKTLPDTPPFTNFNGWEP